MSSGTRRAEFFALEAEEYLLDLDLVASAHEAPDAERMIRGARALRGAALVAGLGTYARAAAGLESLSRQIRDETIPWDSTVRDQCLTMVNALRGLLSRVRAWDGAADREALMLAERAERFAGSNPVRIANAAALTLTTGVRAFIAKESALIAGSLERAARALSPLAPNEALAAVLEKMRSLRGLGASAELSPLPEMLDALEIATRTLLGDDPPPPDVAEVFDEAARALAAMAHTIAESGRISVSPELERVAMRLLRAYAEEPDVVTMEALAPDGEESVVTLGVAPGPPPNASPVPIELVGVGDHLLLIADTLARPGLPVVRDLRLFVLHRTLATMPPRSATGQFLAPLTTSINTAIAHDVPRRHLDHFITMLRACGQFLVDSGSSTDARVLIRERDRLSGEFVRGELGVALGSSRPSSKEPTPPLSVHRVDETVSTVADIVASAGITSLVPDLPEITSIPVTASVPEPDPAPEPVTAFVDDEADVVPIQSLAPEEIPDIASLAPEEIPSITSLAPDPVVQQVIATAFTDQNDDDLIGTPIVPIEALAPDEVRFPFAGLIPLEAPGEPSRLELAWKSQRSFAALEDLDTPSLERLLQQDILPMDSLLYRGRTALARAAEVQRGLEARLKEPAVSLELIRPDLEELMDLVELARDAA